MEKMSVKKIPLKVKEVEKLQEILNDELGKCMDIQVFLEKSLFDEIRYNCFDHNMSPEFEEESVASHYGKDMQDLYEFQDSKGIRSEGIVGFVANCKGMLQITRFKKGRLDYTHYLKGMRKVIVIYEDK